MLLQSNVLQGRAFGRCLNHGNAIADLLLEVRHSCKRWAWPGKVLSPSLTALFSLCFLATMTWAVSSAVLSLATVDCGCEPKLPSFMLWMQSIVSQGYGSD